jgi:hypothetical protein
MRGTCGSVSAEFVPAPCRSLPMHDPGAGPPVINGMLDLSKGRVLLGVARIVYAGLVVGAISGGLLLGLALLDASLPVDESSRFVPLWLDMIAAGIAVGASQATFSRSQRHAA